MLGYFLGEQWNRVSDKAHRWLLVGGAVLLATAAAVWLLRRKR